MDLPQEDALDSISVIAGLLVTLQETSTSIYIKRDMNFLNVVPPPSDDIIEIIHDHYLEIAALLPGFCDSCDLWFVRRIEAFWGAHPHFCQGCMARAIEYFERTKRWPEVKMPDTL